MKATAELKMLPVSVLKPAAYNPRKKLKPGDKEYEKIKNSITEFGFADPLVVNADMTIIGGHQRLTVAMELGYTEVPCAVVDIDKTREKALNIALNKITGAWDDSLLADLLKDIEDSNFDLGKTGFEPPEIETLFNKVHSKEVKEDDFDVESELKQPCFSKEGDLWHLGKHIVLCGDSTKAECYDSLMDGTKANLVLSDPPYLYQGRDVKEDKDRCLKDQILVIAPHEALISSDTWLKCRKKLMANTTFQQGRKPKNTWLAGKIKCGHCGYALKATHVPNSTGYFRCTKRTENKGCPGCGKIRKEEFEQFIFSAMQEKFKDFQILHGREEKVNPKLTAYQVELAQVESEIEKLLDTLTGANATLLAYANKKIEELDTRRQTISKAIAELSVETISPQQIKKLSYYLDNWDSIDFDDKRKAADGLISTIKATSDRVQIEWKI